MKKLFILTVIAGILAVAVVVASQGFDKKMVVKTELAASPAVVPFNLVDVAYISAPTGEVIRWLVVPDRASPTLSGFTSQVFHPPLTSKTIRETSYSEYRRHIIWRA